MQEGIIKENVAAGADASLGTLSAQRRALLALLLNKNRAASPSPEESEQGRFGLPATPIKRVSREPELPLSFAQQRLWFLNQLDPDGYGYNMPSQFRLEGDLDLNVLERCFSEVIRRHESLRTTFEMRGGRPAQVISHPNPHRIRMVDISALDQSERSEEARRLSIEEIQRPFDLSTGPLLRTTLLRLAEEDYVMLLTVHHIVSDGWSSVVLIREVGLLYEAFSDARRSPLPELQIQYVDYACWQREWLQGEVLDEQLAYWEKQLGGELPLLEFAIARPRPAVQTYRGARQIRGMSIELSRGLKLLSRQEGVTLFMTLLAAFNVLLERYTGQSDIIVGTPIANRNRAEIEELIGCFVNTLVMRSDLGGDPTFRELLGRVREMALGAYAHQGMPFDKLVESLRPKRDLRRNPLFQVMFILQNNPELAMELPGPRLTPMLPEVTATDFDLNLSMMDEPKGLSASLEYNTDLFQPQTIDRMLGHFETLLESVVANPNQRISALPLLTGAERRRMSEWNRTDNSSFVARTIHGMVEEQAGLRPDDVALICGNQRISYGEMNARANQLARYLRRLGVRPEQRVGICTDRSSDMVIGLLGILKAGGAYVPMDPAYPNERLAWMLEDSQVNVLLTKTDQAGSLPETKARLVLLDAAGWDEIAGEDPDNLEGGATPDNLAYVIYTSGSTGRPKGVLIAHANVAHLFSAFAPHFPFRPGEVWTVFHSCAFDFSVWEIWAPLVCGGRLVVVTSEIAQSPEAFYELLVAEQVTVLNQTPSAFRQLVQIMKHRSPRAEGLALSRIVLGGETLLREIVNECPLDNVTMWNLYGPTEATVWSSFYEITKADGTIPIGRPLDNTQTYLLDSHLNIVPVLLPAELFIGGYGLARGYQNRPDLTAERFVPNPFSDQPGQRLYRTGDLARYRDDGEMDFLGRIDHQIKLRAFRIEPGEIEAVLAQHPAVENAVVVARYDRAGDARLVAYVVPAANKSPSVADLRNFLDQKLPHYMIPAQFVTLDALPLSPNGKVDRKALPAPDGARPRLAARYNEPRTDAERELGRIWSEVLGLEQVGIDDNFFELGGDSILGIQVIARANQAGLSLSPKNLFQCPTIAELARASHQAQKGEIDSHSSSANIHRPTSDDTDLASNLLEKQDEQIEEAYSISPMQQGMLFHSLFAPDAGEYLEQIICAVSERIDVEAFEQAWQTVVDRHSVLRTAFKWENLDEPIQVVYRDVQMRLDRHDLSELSGSEQQARIQSYLESDRRGRRFDPATAPLLGVALFRMAESSYQFLLSYHHLLMDGWSLPLLIQEVSSCYKSICSDEAPEPMSSRPYRDYIEWIKRQDLSKAEAFWRQELNGFGAPTALAAGARPGSAPFQQDGYGQQDIRLSAATTSSLQSLARQTQLTLSTLLHGAWALLLSRYSGEEDVVFGGVVSGRPADLEGVESMIGLFINTLPVRARVKPEDLLISWLRQLQTRQVEARQYEYSPLVKVQRWSDVSPGLSLFESVLVLDHYPMRSSLGEMGDSSWASEVKSLQRTGYPLHVMIVPGPEMFIRLTYLNKDFDTDTIGRMLGHYRTLLEGIPACAAGRLSDLRMLTDSEWQQLIEEWNNTLVDSASGECMHQVFEDQAARTPGVIAATCEDQSLTYRDLNHRANRLARSLVERGVESDSLVALLAERGLDFLTAVLAVFKAGGAYIPLDPRHPAIRHRQVLEESRCQIVLAASDFLPALYEALDGLPSGKHPQMFCLEDLLQNDLSDRNLPSRCRPGDLAYVIYTSGSTGVPKGAMVEHTGMLNHLYAKIDALGLNEADILAQTASQCFDISVWQFLAPLMVGGQVVIFKDDIAFDPSRLAEEVARQRVGIFETVPSLLRAILGEEDRQSRRQLSALRWMIPTGEALPPELCRQWFESYPGIPLLNAYGPTECSDDVTHYCITGPPSEEAVRTPIGRPIANARMYILDRSLLPAPVGIAGELCVGGTAVGRGYLKRPELTAAKFIPDPFSGQPGARLYRTGDLALYLADGNIEFVGRLDHQIKLRGYRIEPGEIEVALAEHKAIRQALVVVREDEPGKKRLVAYIVADEEVDGEQLRQTIKLRLPEYMIPDVFVRLEAIPLTPNGKLDRKNLPAPELTEALKKHSTAARTPAEQIVAGIWCEVLGLERVGIRDDFFEMGGHSLLATQVVSRLREAFGTEIPLRDVFDRPTVETLTEAVETAVRAREGLQIPPITVAPQVAESELSFGQLRLWFLDQLEPGSSSYNIPAAVRLIGKLEVMVLERALNEIVRRHEALRTTFSEVNGRPVPVIQEAQALRLPIVDVRHLPDPGRKKEVERLATEEAKALFSLSAGPLIRAKLVRVGDDEHAVLLTMHHIVSDGWSAGVFVREVTALYEAFSRGEESPLGELEIQYADYAHWQRQWLQGEALEEQLAYWRRQLGGELPVVELPADRLRPTIQTYRGAAESLALDGKTARAVRALSRREGVTLFMVLLAALKVLLHRYSGQLDIIVGTPIAGRNRKETEELIGFFINTLALRTDLSGDPSFKQLLQRVREVALGAYAHQDMPFEKLVEVLQPERDLGRSPVFQVMLNVLNLREERVYMPGLRVEAVPFEMAATKFDLTLYATETEEEIALVASYNRDLFTRERIAELLRQMDGLLRQVTSDPTKPISEYSLVTGAAEEWLPDPTRPLADTWTGPVQDRISEQARRAPRRIAISDGPRQLTYGELERQSNQLARCLQQQGIEHGDVVAIYAERSAALAVSMLGTLKAGAAFLVLDRKYPAERQIEYVKQARPRMFIEVEAAGEVPGLLSEFIETEQTCRRLRLAGKPEELSQYSDGPVPVTTSSDDTAYIIFTSGTTGEPKGIATGHGPLSHFIEWEGKAFGLDSRDRFSLLSGLSHDPLMRDVFTALCSGATLCIPSANWHEDLQGLIEWMKQQEISVTRLTPALGRLLTQGALNEKGQLVSLRYAFFCGDVLTAGDVRRVRELAPWAQCVNYYGTSETPQAMSFFVVDRALATEDTAAASPLPIGEGITDVQLLIINDYNRMAGVGELGEICVRTPHLSKGYIASEAETRERFTSNPITGASDDRVYRTGDLGRYLPDGKVHYVRRIDAQIKLRGYRIEPGEIEAVLLEHKSIKQAAVIAREDPPGEKRLVAYTVSDQEVDVGRLREDLKQRLPEYMIPSTFVRLDLIPLTPNGKVDRRALPEPGRANQRGKASYVAPRTATEREVANIWEELLNVEQIGATDNFFDLGGHSLLATQVMSHIRERFRIELSLRKMFEQPTVSGLSVAIEDARADGAETSPVTIVAAERSLRRMRRTASGELQSIEVQSPVAATALPGPGDAEALIGQLPKQERRASVDFSLFFFSDDGSSDTGDKYRLLHESVKYADRNGFRAVWTPERHFHDFGGLYPNPSVTSAALAMMTERIEIRAGSVVLPLQDPLRVAEEWSMVDNLTGGRVAIAFASGWHVNDFVLNPEAYERRRELMYEGIEMIQRLWRGEAVKKVNGAGNEVEVRVYPRPIQRELPIWITCQSDETFEKAGAIGANVLTNFNYKREQELAERIETYRNARRRSGVAGEGLVTLMMHTFVWDDIEKVREKVRTAYGEYLETNLGLQAKLAAGLNVEASISQEDRQVLIENATQRLIDTHGLVGTVEACAKRARNMAGMGVDEIACLIDFGVERTTVLESLSYLNKVKEAISPNEQERTQKLTPG